MAYQKFTLHGSHARIDGTFPKSGHVEITPVGTGGEPLREVKDTTGDTILYGRAKLDFDEAAEGKWQIELPDPNDTSLAPSMFGYRVTVALHDSRMKAVSFGPDQITGATVMLEDVTPVDPSTFDPQTTLVEQGEFDALELRVVALEETPAVTSWNDLTDKPTIPDSADDVGALPATATAADIGAETPEGAQAKATAAELAAKGYTDAEIAALADTAPETLDTLNELAAALGDDPNFATTVTNQIATRETPAGAQEKADAAETNANTYTDGQITAEVTRADGAYAAKSVQDTVESGRLSEGALNNAFGRRAIDLRQRAEGITVDDFTSANHWDRLAGGAGTTTASGGVLSLAATTAGAAYRRGRYLHMDLSGKVLSFRVRKDANLSVLRIYLTTGDDYALTRFFKWDMGVAGLRAGDWETVALSPAYSIKGGGATVADLGKIRQIGIEVVPSVGTTSTLEIKDFRVHDKVDHRPAIIWQFDDGHLDTHAVAYPILAAAGFVGSVGPMPDRHGPADPNYMTIAQLQELHATGWETFGHYYTNFTDVSLAQAEVNMRAVKTFLVNNGLTRGADFLAWPSSAYNAPLEDIALRMFSYLRRFDGTNLQYIGEPFIANRRDITITPMTASQTVQTAKNRMDAIANFGGVLNLVFHKIVPSGAAGADYNRADFQDLVNYATTLGLRSTTMTDEWGGMGGTAPFIQNAEV